MPSPQTWEPCLAERRFLAKVGAQVESLEKERAAALSTTLTAAVRIYGWATSFRVDVGCKVRMLFHRVQMHGA